MRWRRALPNASPPSLPSLLPPPSLRLQGAGYTPGCELNHNRNHPVNVHGCGIGWYACEKCGLVDKHGLSAFDRPTVYTTVAAPSHDRNLRSLSKTISTSLLFGHVRAAGPGASVHQYNCHPFRKGRYMFMHNGEVVGFKSIRRGLLNKLRDELFEDISGTTDSELLFNLILNELPDVQTRQDTVTLQRAVLKGICAIISACKGKPRCVLLTLVPIRPRSRCELHSLRTFPKP
jgi:glutamine amidotransferase